MRDLRSYWLSLFPPGFVYADQLTVSAKRLIVRTGVGAVGVIVGVSAAGLLNTTNWKDVLAGALLAWGVSVIVWASSSYRRGADEIRNDLRHSAELDLLHARLNQISARLDVRQISLDRELEEILGARTERLAHFSGLDEFREEALTIADGYVFWDETALGNSIAEPVGCGEHSEPHPL
jgi:hypothetical protein